MNINNLLFVTANDVFSKILYIFIAIIVLMVMIMIHEFGHYTAGKLLKFKINEFSVGMGPKIFSKKRKNSDEVFSLRAIPLGGFCAFEGEDEDQKENPEAFNSQKPWKRLIVLFSGAFFNFLSAVLIVIITFTFIGAPIRQVHKVYETSPNYNNNTIIEGDVILEVNGEKIDLVTDLNALVANAGDTFTVKVFRPNNKDNANTVFSRDPDGQYLLISLQKGEYSYEYEGKTYTAKGIGISSTTSLGRKPFFTSIGESFLLCAKIGTVVLKTLGQLITGAIGLDAVGGPISTIGVMSQAIQNSFINIFYLIILISVNLAVFNLLPIPALDGCRMVFVIIEWIFHKPVNRKVEGYINFVGIVLLLIFVVLIDVLKWF